MPTITIRLDDETSARLKRHLAASGETLSDFVRDALSRQLEEKPRARSRLAALDAVLDQIEDTGETELSQTYRTRRRELALAKHRR